MGWPAVVEDGLFWLSVLLLCLFSDSLYIFLCVLDSLPWNEEIVHINAAISVSIIIIVAATAIVIVHTPIY